MEENCYLMKIVTKLKKKIKSRRVGEKSNTNRSQYPVPFENNIWLHLQHQPEYLPLGLELDFQKLNIIKASSIVKEK